MVISATRREGGVDPEDPRAGVGHPRAPLAQIGDQGVADRFPARQGEGHPGLALSQAQRRDVPVEGRQLERPNIADPPAPAAGEEEHGVGPRACGGPAVHGRSPGLAIVRPPDGGEPCVAWHPPRGAMDAHIGGDYALQAPPAKARAQRREEDRAGTRLERELGAEKGSEGLGLQGLDWLHGLCREKVQPPGEMAHAQAHGASPPPQRRRAEVRICP
jgi:hypothetical protein